MATTSPTRGSDDVTDRYVVDLPVLSPRTTTATITADAIERLALDDVMLFDLVCQPDNAAIAVIIEHLVIPVELSPADRDHGAPSRRP